MAVLAGPALDTDLRDAAISGLALADQRGDPLTAAAARLARLAETDPDVTPHGATRAGLPVGFV